MLGDGNQSDLDDPFEDCFEDEDPVKSPFRCKEGPYDHIVASTLCDSPETPTRQRPKPATLPVRVARPRPGPRPGIPSAFLSDADIRLPRRSSNIGLARYTARTQRHPDRFIPSRSDSTNTVEKYRAGKTAHELKPSEKLLRHDGASEDAFCYRRRNITPMAADFRPQSISESVPSQNRGLSHTNVHNSGCTDSLILVGSVLGPLDQNGSDGMARQVSNGNVWSVGGVAPGGTAVDNGRGQFVRSGTNARLFRTSFPSSKPRAEEEMEKHEARLAEALGLDRTNRILETNVLRHRDKNSRTKLRSTRTKWNGTEWVNEGSIRSEFLELGCYKTHRLTGLNRAKKAVGEQIASHSPIQVSLAYLCNLNHLTRSRVLDAPNLRDDFYCSILAYSATCRTLAVGLSDLLYGWSETGGVKLLNLGTARNCHLTSVAFSSTEGGKGILAYGRTNKTLGLMSLHDDPEESNSHAGPLPRFEVNQPAPVTCLSWKPTCTLRPSKSPINPGALVKTEDLLVGDEVGCVYYYAIEWPERWEVERDNWAGSMVLLAKVTVHSQQICGLSWSRDGELFATGGNDNLCYLFQTSRALDAHARAISEVHEGHQEGQTNTPAAASVENSEASSAITEIQRPGRSLLDYGQLNRGDEKHQWLHRAAVKAIAFCPWQDGLVATGGGSNDKCIHFFHTTSGAPLATISVSAQVTSLIWSTTRKEIAATFGYAQPDHPVRIAVFSWPECRQVAAIPWAGEHRALYAIPFPGGPENAHPARNSTGARSHSRTAMEGCIMVASSDKSVKFHEVWAADKKTTAGGVGMLGGSEILESLEGIDRDRDVIR